MLIIYFIYSMCKCFVSCNTLIYTSEIFVLKIHCLFLHSYLDVGQLDTISNLVALRGFCAAFQIVVKLCLNEIH
jgi:hypothetical protein